MPSLETNPQNVSKYTRGEKCIFYHLLVTLLLIVILVIIYLIHLSVVKHDKLNYSFKTYGRTVNMSDSFVNFNTTDYEYIGVVYLTEPVKIICNVLLLRDIWSLAPAQCTSMRDDPDMARYLPFWKIKYKINQLDQHTDIQRTLTHVQFNRADYKNNIGLFRHTKNIVMEHYYVAPDNIILTDELLNNFDGEMTVLNWDLIGVNEPIAYRARPISSDKCKTYTTPIVDRLRDYEFCVTFQQIGPSLDHGALLVLNSRVVGYFSWGDITAKGVPFIILDIVHFRNWFESITSLQNYTVLLLF